MLDLILPEGFPLTEAQILYLIGALYGVANIIVGLTPTPKDNSVLAKVRTWLHRFGLLRFSDEPGTLKAPGLR